MPAAAVPAVAGPAAAAPAAPSALEVALQRYLRHVAIERGLATNTVAAYRRDLTGYLALLASRGVTTPGQVAAADVSAFAVSLRIRAKPALPKPALPKPTLPDSALRDTVPAQSALTASSIARMLSSVRTFHRYLVDEALVGTNVAADVTPPKLAMRLPKAITIAQMTAVLESAGGDDLLSLRDRALLELLYATGARISEAVDLNVDDILSGGANDSASSSGRGSNGSGDLVRLFGKGGKQRIVPVGSFARAALDAYLVRSRPTLSLRGESTPALFLGARGMRVSRQNAWLIIRARAEQSGIGVSISPHTFRHSFATHLLAGGADVRVVQELLGHSSVATTQIYTQVTADTLRDMYTTAHPRAR